MIGTPFRAEEHRAVDVISGLGPCIVAANDPPWSTLAPLLHNTVAVVDAWDMELAALEGKCASDEMQHARQTADVVVGIGGGTALDTAKLLASRLGLRLVQIPTIASVDAGFTDAIGVRDCGHVRYIDRIVPELVVIDIDLIRSAPQQLNRAGIGDILSCHTGLFDWALSIEAEHGHPHREDLAALGRRLLRDLDAATAEIANVTPDGIRFLLGAYREIGAACAEAGHSRFEEGSEHFWAYAYEHSTGAHHVHGELISFAVVAMSHLQGNDPVWARDIVVRSGARAHPGDLGIDREVFLDTVANLRTYVRAEGLDYCIANERTIVPTDAIAAYEFCESLPRA